MCRLFFLPGVGGDPNFWRGLGDLLPGDWSKTYFGWPGLGSNPPDPNINAYEDLIAMVEVRLLETSEPVDLLAQSMGGAIAMTLALRHPRQVRRLVLAVTAGGMDIDALGATDWRPEYRHEFPQVADWVISDRPDVSARIPDIRQPALLIWGDSDPISPLAVGKYLATHLPDASLHVLPGGEHDLVRARPLEIVSLIEHHLA
ncbi:MAG TPA: alpha/beta fold hydrolase [Asticcacaulis sp.]|nr:alpha/beta fold hydrolase [Asticcacaulis sp.]